MSLADFEGIGPGKLVPKPVAGRFLASLGPQEGFVLSRIDGKTSITDICQLVPFDPLLTGVIVKRLWAVGAIEIPGATAPRPAMPAPPATEKAVDPRAEPPEPRASAATGASAAPARATDGTLSAEQRKRIDQVFESLGKADAFTLLEVDREADKRALKRAYFKLSKEFHPDRHFGKDLGEYQRRLSEIFRAIKAAFELLNDDERRKAYLDRAPRR